MAQTVHITIDQGSDFSWTFDLSKLAPTANVTGASAFASMVKELDEPLTTVAFVTSLDGHELTISMTNDVTIGLDPDTWVYDAILVAPDGKVTRVVQGRARVDQQVTKI